MFGVGVGFAFPQIYGIIYIEKYFVYNNIKDIKDFEL